MQLIRVLLERVRVNVIHVRNVKNAAKETNIKQKQQERKNRRRNPKSGKNHFRIII